MTGMEALEAALLAEVEDVFEAAASVDLAVFPGMAMNALDRAEIQEQARERIRELTAGSNPYHGEQVAALLLLQDGKCAACGRSHERDYRTGRGLLLDHDHTTGLTRGLLCSRCNSLVAGWLVGDDRVTVALKSYLADPPAGSLAWRYQSPVTGALAQPEPVISEDTMRAAAARLDVHYPPA